MDESIEVLLQALTEGDEARRIEAAQALAHLEKSSQEIVRLLESLVICDPSSAVQEAALAALASPLHHEIHRQLILTSTYFYERQAILLHIDPWVAEGLITPQIAALLKGRYAPDPPRPPKPEAVIPREPAAPKTPIEKKGQTFEEYLASEEAVVIEQPLLEKQKFSLIGTFTSETTIKIALYLGAFLIVSAAVIFAGLVEPARFPMLTLTLLGFLTAARVTIQRLPLGSFVLFVIGTLLIPIDAAIFFALINIHVSLLCWSVVAAGMSLIWAWGTYVYRSRALSLAVFATFSTAVYLVAASYLAVESAQFLLVVSLVALAGLGETSLLRRWQGDDFAEPMFTVAQLQALAVLGILGTSLLSQVNDLVAWIVDERRLSSFDSQDASLLAAWLILGVFYFASDQITRRWKKWDFTVFPLLVTVCLMTPPVFIIEAISANPHQIAAVLWGWGAFAVLAAEAFHLASTQWLRRYALLFLYASILFLVAAPLVEYVTTLEYAVGYFLATSVVYFVFAYRRKYPASWTVALITAYLAYLVGARSQSTGELPGGNAFVQLVPVLVFLSVELAGRRYFRASELWTVPPLLLGLFNIVWDVGILLSWYNEHPGSAAIIYVIYGLFGALYAALDDQRERGQATAAWTAGLIAVYAAYIYTLPNVSDIDFGGYMLLAPALVFLSAELAGKRYFQAGPSWTLPLLGLGLFNVGLDVLATLVGGLGSHISSASIIFLIYGLFGVLYAVLDMRFERDYATTAWTAGLIALYAAYGFIFRLPAIQDLDIFPGFVLLLPMLVFLSAELVGKLRFRLSQFWTLPLFGSGLFNAVLVVPVTLGGGLNSHPDSAVIIFLIYGLFAILYAVLDVRVERDSAVAAWTAGLIALYAAYGFIFRLPAIQDLDIFLGFVLLLPALAFLSTELVGKLHFQASEYWTLPLFGLGLLSAALMIPVTLDGGLGGHSGSAAIIFLVSGLFAALYTTLDARPDWGYVATSSLALALTFALLFYDQDRWVIPFTALTLLYYLGGPAISSRGWSQVLRWSGLALGTATALSAPVQGGGDAVVGMGVIATLYGAEAFRRRNVWLGLPANGLFLGAYLLALQELHVTEPQFYSIGTGLLAIVTHYLLTRRSKQQEAFVIGFATGVIAQVILLGTSFIQMSTGLHQFFFLLFFQSLILLAYGLVIHSLSFIIIPILFIVGGVLRVVFTLLASYSTVVTIGCTGFALVLLGITALIMRERLMKTYEGLRQPQE